MSVSIADALDFLARPKNTLLGVLGVIILGKEILDKVKEVLEAARQPRRL